MASRYSSIQTLFRLALILLLAAVNLPAIDVWDQASPNDDTPANTRNVLIPGDPPQRHDVEAKAGPTADQDWYRLVVAAGHSYEVRVGGRQDDCFDFTGANFRVLDADLMEITTGFDYPGADAIQTATRATFVAPTIEVVFVQLVGATTCTDTSEYSIQLFDTTLISPFFTTAGVFESFYRMVNTTNASITGELTFFNSAGNVVFTTQVTIPGGGSTPTFNTGPTGFNIADNLAGPVRFTHNGPPGGILIDAFAGVFGTTTAVLPLKFERATP
ncbi:MAG: hypothetical protein L0Z62_17855 [Gemmataceae bacterium]|nr:hypothetical protein [Gemmataceae bacterium]